MSTTLVMRKQQPLTAIKFDGINAKELQEFVGKERLIIIEKPFAPDFFPIPYLWSKDGNKIEIKKNDWIVLDNRDFIIYDSKTFEYLFSGYIEPDNKEYKTYAKISIAKARKKNNDEYEVIYDNGFTATISNEEFEKTYIPLEKEISDGRDKS